MNTLAKNIEIISIACCVPSTRVRNVDSEYFSTEEAKKFIDTTGVSEYRVASENITTSDLGLVAAESLFKNSSVNKNEIDVLVFVSQTPDYNCVPNTSTILQHKLNLNDSCVCFDVPLGCSGYTYGIQIISAFLQLNNFRYGILIAGDTPSKTVGKRDKSSAMLFGDAASATLIKRTDNKVIFFNNGTDGSGYKSIIIEDGGFRNPVSHASFFDIDHGKSIVHNKLQLHLDGLEVFSFGINRAPKSIEDLLFFSGFKIDDVDFFIMHQANLLMNEMIRKKIKIPTEKTLYSLSKFGNTSSASIPLTIVANRDKFESSKNYKCLLSGFGVGLSWNSILVEINKKSVLKLTEL
jgi:3-oxoacyl-[acyl-carrier-protein] synthase-3